MLGLNPLLLAGASVIALGGAWWFGHESGTHERDGRLGSNFEKRLAIEREVAVRREVNLWTQIGDERQARVEMIAAVQRIDTLSEEARAAMKASMDVEKRKAQAALSQAAQNIQELKDAASAMATDWKAGRIPPDITCGVFNGSGCAAPAYPASRADPHNDLEVREPATGAGDAS